MCDHIKQVAYDETFVSKQRNLIKNSVNRHQLTQPSRALSRMRIVYPVVCVFTGGGGGVVWVFQHYITESCPLRVPQHSDTPPKSRCASASRFTVMSGGRGLFCCCSEEAETERARAAARGRAGRLVGGVEFQRKARWF